MAMVFPLSAIHCSNMMAEFDNAPTDSPSQPEARYKITSGPSLLASHDAPVSLQGLTIASYYSYGTPNGASYNGTVVEARNDTAVLFLAEASDGVYLVIVMDRPNSGTEGTATIDMTTTGLVGRGMNFVVQDEISGGADTYAWDDLTGTGTVCFTWATCCTDGLAFGPLPEDASYSATINFSALTGIDQAQYFYTDDSGSLTSVEISPALTSSISITYQAH